jgi:3-dehydrosphinganine reductase
MSKTDRRVRGKNIIITGGSSGIGKATAKLLAEHGANVFILARDREKLNQALEEIKAEGGDQNQRYGAFSADVTSWQEVESTIADIVEAGGAPDILINSAGIVHPGYFEELPLSAFRKQIDVNYLGTLHCVKAVLPYMTARKSGHIVNISSIAGFLGIFGYTAYSASKFAVRGFTEALRIELKPHNITVSMVIPNDTDTPQLEDDRDLQPLETKITEGMVKPENIGRRRDLIVYRLVKLVTDGGKPAAPEEVAAGIIRGIRRGRYLIASDPLFGLVYHFRGMIVPLANWAFDQLVPLARRQRGVE